LQYSLLITCIIGIIGGSFILIALYITSDQRQAERATAGRHLFKQSQHAVRFVSGVILEGRCTGMCCVVRSCADRWTKRLSMACCIQYGIVVTVIFLVYLGMLTNIIVI
jgi:hypothetical protein